MKVIGLLAVAACGSAAPEDTGRTVAESAAASGDASVDQSPDSTRKPTFVAGGDTTRAPARLNLPTVLIIGTSLTAGYGLDQPEHAYPAVLQRMADSAGYRVRIVNAGLSGETSAGALRRIDWVLREPADFVIVETGANDGLRGLNVDSTRANLRGLVDRIKASSPRTQIALVEMESPPNLGEAYTSRFRQSFAAVAREKRVQLLPFLLDGVAGIPRFNQGDGIHPNRDGAELVARNLWREIEPVIRGLGSRP